MLEIVIHQEAEELWAAASYYESCQPSLGEAFLDEIAFGFDRILQFPSSGEIIIENIRRSLLHRFPDALVYHVENEGLSPENTFLGTNRSIPQCLSLVRPNFSIFIGSTQFF